MPRLATVPLALPEIVVITPARLADSRGYFVETYNAQDFAGLGIRCAFVQDNQALSQACGTVRGLHFQAPPMAQAKLVRVLKGRIFDVAVDIRRGSANYGRWCATTLSASGGEQVFVPHGFAHGYCTLEPNTEVAYKVDNFYNRECEEGLNWNDPAIGIAWPIAASEALLSDKDCKLPLLADFKSPFSVDLSVISGTSTRGAG